MPTSSDKNRRSFLKLISQFSLLGVLGGLCGFSVRKSAKGHTNAGFAPGSNACGRCSLCNERVPGHNRLAFGEAPDSGGSLKGIAQQHYVWQIDPDKCIASEGCGGCEGSCVLETSAVKAVQCYAVCANCDGCTAYFKNASDTRDGTMAEKQLCPTGAIERAFILETSEPFFEYNVDESLCIGCGDCVEGCAKMAGSMYLQIRHNLCTNCNECAIAKQCPADAIIRVPVEHPYLLKQNRPPSDPIAALKAKFEETEKK